MIKENSLIKSELNKLRNWIDKEFFSGGRVDETIEARVRELEEQIAEDHSHYL